MKQSNGHLTKIKLLSTHYVARDHWKQTVGGDDCNDSPWKVVDELFGLIFFPDQHYIEDSGQQKGNECLADSSQEVEDEFDALKKDWGDYDDEVEYYCEQDILFVGLFDSSSSAQQLVLCREFWGEILVFILIFKLLGFGFAPFPENIDNAYEIVSRAEEHQYNGEQDGKNIACVYDIIQNCISLGVNYRGEKICIWVVSSQRITYETHCQIGYCTTD